jgi:hypothetical protein
LLCSHPRIYFIFIRKKVRGRKMRTLIRTSLVVSMALAFLCMTAPLGYTHEASTPKFPCPNCGVANEYPKCPPGVYKISQNGCPDIKDIVGPIPVVDLRPPEDPDLAHVLSPAWSPDGALGESTACHKKCGVAFPVDSIISFEDHDISPL